MTINELIKKSRTEKNISLGDLSKLTGIPKSTLQRYETGDTAKIPVEAISLIEKALVLPTGRLLGWDTEKHINSPSPSSDEEYTEIEKDLVTNYRKLDDEGKIKLDGYLEDLVRLHNLNIQKINDKHKALTLDNTKIEESDIEFIEKLVELKEKE